ncbi:aminotransferase class I/II-fold pyridoxal phosphate-dependent enzyme [Bacillus paranthracis]|uniref:aminotransferase class I/II-fold pyridoxal phosphate-dependent enzyme n=1 Tax=Bacillus cereus group TaxID=86661 RepID=UPI000C323C59|nr:MULTISPECIES: aminotransferase class I/II-fold pyridoxal phosphate-dependent enzyme [Bacillus cereus group]MBL3844718.1 aminotransferase class I/II-fold pyridoxal phosphate-dependent enzyme [Bacillus cereus]MDA1588042.1 aminotransferase class I/II-fold pyridoxal phosphate-dependent enzyme [Bacillus cereus group sp. TH225LC]MDA1888965.1 aminotransferase class I/II-fold pyridoxal phosphate-dependent enzyme [Bacillus cereus group sp. BY11-1LC]MDA2588970.1 aminotransferase class I/II-fold pyrido
MIKNKEKIYLSSPHMSGNEQKYIKDAFDSNWIAPLGPNVDEFERELASFVGVKGGAAVSSGTAAIHLALRLLDVQKGDTVFCSSFTFVASANPIVYLGAEPVFIDSEPETWNMSPQALAFALHDANKAGKLPKAVILVHLYGQSAKVDEILSLCNQYDVPIIEDAAESLGSTYKGKASGTFGRFGIYSFNGNKIITTSGGGMLVSDDVEALEKARFLATQAKDPAPHYEHSKVGYNYRMSNILAGIGRGQLEVLEDRVRARRSVYKRYYKELSLIPGFYFMPELENTRSNRWLTTLTIDEKESAISSGKLLRILAEENIEARPMWKPLHLQPLFKGKKYYPHSKNEDMSQYLFQSGICLPSGSNMLEEDQQRVIQGILKAVEWKK